jgi:membrane-bound ClpP family serine protease
VHLSVPGRSVVLVDALLDEPVIVLIALSLAAALFIVEVALPTAGVAGTLALLLGVVAAAAIVHQDAVWWPLVGPKLAVVLWAVMIARRRRSPVLEATAVVAFAGGSVVFGVLADSPVAVGVGVALAAALGGGFPRLHERARRLLDQPPLVGREALVGQVAEVIRWDGIAGTVRLAGSLWNATSEAPLTEGDPVAVVSWSGSTLGVAPRLPHPTT